MLAVSFKYLNIHLSILIWKICDLIIASVRFWRSKVKTSNVPLDPSSFCCTGSKSPPSTVAPCPEFLKLFQLFIRMLLWPRCLSSSCLSGWFLMLLLHVAASLWIFKVCTLNDVYCRRSPFLWTTTATIRRLVGFLRDQISTVTQLHLHPMRLSVF